MSAVHHAGKDAVRREPAVAAGELGDPITVRDYVAGDEASILELLRISFEQWPAGLGGVDPAEFFRWKLLENPFGPSLMYVAELAGKTIGFEARMAWRLRAGTRTFLTMRGVDLAVHPAFRRRGVSMAIRRAAHYSDEVDFTWGNPSRQSRGGSLKFGRREVGVHPHFIRPRVAPLGWVRQALSSAPARACPAVSAPLAAEVLAEAGALESLLAAAPLPRGRFVTDKDAAYLHWRYRLGAYHAIAAPGGVEQGVAVFRVRPRGSLWVTDVCELIVAGRDRATERGLLAATMSASAADMVCCCFPGVREAALCGFVQAPKGTSLVAMPLQRTIEPDPAQMGSWALSRGDLELM